MQFVVATLSLVVRTSTPRMGMDPSTLPAPLRATDGGFTHDTVSRRLPLIVKSVVSNNPSFSAELAASLNALSDEIVAGAPLKPLAADKADGRDGWSATLAPYVASGGTWMDAPWFVVENYLYKRILELTDGPTGGADPFATQKAKSLVDSADAFVKIVRLANIIRRPNLR